MHSVGTGKDTQIWLYSRWLVCVVQSPCDSYYTETAVTARNIVFDIDPDREGLDSEFAKLPPCKVESNVSIDGVEYPIVRSYPVPSYAEWDYSWGDINRRLITLINFGHGMWPCCWKFAFSWSLPTVRSISAQMEKRKKSPPTWEKSRMGKSLRPPEIILGLPYTSKADIWVLGCTVGLCFCSRFALLSNSSLLFKDISFVDWQTTRARGKGRRRWGHAWLAYFHVRGSYSA